MPIVSMNPYTGETIKEFEALSDSEIKSKLDKAQAVFEEWKTKSYEDRADLFMKFAEVLEENKQEYAEIIAQEMGKPIKVGIGEIEKCAWNARFYAENTSKFLEIEPIETDAGEKSLVRFDPMGIIVFVMPWNFPFWQVIRQAVPTIMAGNTVVLKHSSNVPQSALKIQEAFEKTGFPEGTFQTLLIGSDQVEQVISDFRVKAISLTGSEGAGSAVASLGGKYLKKSVMELGGNDPFLVFEDADIASAVKNCASARMKNSGQVCNSPKRVVVLEEVAEEFIKGLKESYEALKLGDPMSEETDLGPLSMESILNDVSAQVEKSVKAGAEIITGGKKPNMEGLFYEPTILLLNPGGKDASELHDSNMPAYHEEIFGPVTSVIIVKNREQAIEIANDSEYGLGASIWTKDVEAAESYVPLLNAGAVNINKNVSSDPRLPIGGVNKSGFGRELSEYGIKEFTNIKSVTVVG